MLGGPPSLRSVRFLAAPFVLFGPAPLCALLAVALVCGALVLGVRRRPEAAPGVRLVLAAVLAGLGGRCSPGNGGPARPGPPLPRSICVMQRCCWPWWRSPPCV